MTHCGPHTVARASVSPHPHSFHVLLADAQRYAHYLPSHMMDLKVTLEAARITLGDIATSTMESFQRTLKTDLLTHTNHQMDSMRQMMARQLRKLSALRRGLESPVWSPSELEAQAKRTRIRRGRDAVGHRCINDVAACGDVKVWLPALMETIKAAVHHYPNYTPPADLFSFDFIQYVGCSHCADAAAAPARVIQNATARKTARVAAAVTARAVNSAPDHAAEDDGESDGDFDPDEITDSELSDTDDQPQFDSSDDG